MSIELRTGRNGKLRPMWYGRHEVNGKKLAFNLGVKIAGTPPASLSLREEGDGAFERSRALAQERLDQFVEEARRKHDSAHLVERIYEIKTGDKIRATKLEKLPDEWAKIPRNRKPSARYMTQCRSTLLRFVEFVQDHSPQIKELGNVSQKLAREFMDAEAERPITAKTWNDTLKLLRATCRHLLPSGSINPLEGIPTRETDTVFRKPFMPDELRTLLDAARDDDFMYPLITTAACTGMRRSDVCTLRWRDVDLKAGILAVKTGKTGAEVEIPIFKPLLAVLKKCSGSKGEYVFPEAAQMLADNDDGLTWRFKAIVAKAFSGIKATVSDACLYAGPEAEASGVAAIRAKIIEGARLDRILDSFHRYMMGASIRQIVKITGRPKATVSSDLKTAQEIIGKTFMRGPSRSSITKTIASVTRLKRPKGRDASVWDWHALRSTFVTLALAANVNEEMVRRVTGHATVDIVRKHYFRPNREQFKTALAAMPDVLTGGTTSQLKTADELTMLAGKVAAGTATQEDKAQLRKLAANV